MVALVIAIMIFGALFTTILTFWHRRLIVDLHAHHPHVWQELGREDLSGRLWPLSLRYPLWSWGSLFFFVTKKFETLRDARFSERALRFRAALLLWFAYWIATLIVLFVLLPATNRP